MNRSLAALTLIILSFSFSSCTLYKTISKVATNIRSNHDTDMPSTVVDTVKPSDVIEKKPVDTIIAIQPNTPDKTTQQHERIKSIDPLWKSRLQYTTFSGKAKISFTSIDESKDFTANFRIKKDSVIWVQITALGGIVQAARVCITKDSFFMVSYIEREYIRIPVSEIAKVLPAKVEFSSLQNLIVGEPLRDGIIKAIADTGKQCTILVEDTSYVQNICYNMTDSTMEKGMICTHDTKGPNALIKYIQYQLTDGRKVSKNRQLNITNGKDQYAVDINFVNMYFDTPLDYPFSFPKNYSRKK